MRSGFEFSQFLGIFPTFLSQCCPKAIKRGPDVGENFGLNACDKNLRMR